MPAVSGLPVDSYISEHNQVADKRDCVAQSLAAPGSCTTEQVLRVQLATAPR